jgi:hypothetical protein
LEVDQGGQTIKQPQPSPTEVPVEALVETISLLFLVVLELLGKGQMAEPT